MTLEQEQKLNEVHAWMQERKRQQIAYPLDEASVNTLASGRLNGNGGSALTQTISLSGSAENITVPAAYSDTILVQFGTVEYEIPII